MKKIIFAAIPVIAATTLVSCMGGVAANRNTVDASVKANEAYEMTAEKAAGFYVLESMDPVGDTTKDSYNENCLYLEADGFYEFNVIFGEIADTETGTYSIGKNGVIKFTPAEDDDDGVFAIVAKGETVVCNGEKLAVEGVLGRSTVTMNYVKTEVKSELPAEEPSEAEETEENTTNEEVSEETQNN